MKASTLLAFTVALLLALGTAVAARQMGLFASAAPPRPAPPEVIRVLVARQNIYEANGLAITPEMLTVRELRQDELEMYNKNRAMQLPPRIEAASLRIPNRNIAADEIITKADLVELAFPDGVPIRLAPGTRAVNVAVPKEQAAGGLIAKGDRVDLLLTSRVCDGDDCAHGAILSTVVAHNIRVIVKRNQLWTVLRPNPDDMPVSFTLEANLYRAALIEFAQTKGTITLLPAASRANDRQVAASAMAVAAGDGPARGTFSIPDSLEYRDEDERSEKMLRGELGISDADLERVFRLRPIVRTPPPPVYKPYVIQHIHGTQLAGQSVFDGKTSEYVGVRPPAAPPSDVRPAVYGPNVAGTALPIGYSFTRPDVALAPKANAPGRCLACEAAKRGH